MGGIYLHIPFCKQACHYCDFHFSTSLKKKSQLVQALGRELQLRKEEVTGTIETIYFGGGTPSLLTSEEIEYLLQIIHTHFTVSEYPEITLEANPDDLSEAVLIALKKAGINRLSIGVQSFFEEDLKLMNRAHNASEAIRSIELAAQYFQNISIDLIYGIPNMSEERWTQNLEQAFKFQVPHLSCYALTVEQDTALHHFIEKGLIAPVDDDLAQQHHAILVEVTEKKGYINYEFSNFGKPGFHSRNNMAYWHGKPYLGVGPSAHSYDGHCRSWNVRNNIKYIQHIEKDALPIEREKLSTTDRYNEYVMTRLRTQEGVSLIEVAEQFGTKRKEYLLQEARSHLRSNMLIQQDDHLRVTKKGKFLSDGIAASLFLVNLD
ncbi:radical SAM family heme chaperone HemW [Candidatus Ulvibacter alkanivorans]|uniref:radical SAM family heme chaperone HemW n=1 Tax=Candidatus Ulvibacter alkanivorans TaxID=2267620 RepID=UPI000DF3005C|nr:radical SAM family heme chaperone HemW [Candidatus Ulvibacter alkanivorans]